MPLRPRALAKFLIFIESWQSFGQAVQTLLQLEENFSKDRNGTLLPKLTLRKNCSSDQKKLLKFKAEGRGFAKCLRSLDQFI